MKITLSHKNIQSILPLAVEWINVLSTLYLISTLILPFEYQRPAIFAYFISTPIDIIVNKRYINNHWHKSKFTFIAMITFYLCMWIWHIFSSCSNLELFHSTDTRLPFIIFGLFGICFSLNPKIKINLITYTMLIASFLVTGYTILQKYDIIFSPDITLNSFRDLLPNIRHELLHVTHIEFNLYLNCTMTLCFIGIIENNKKIIKLLLSIGLLFVYTLLLINEGRTGFITANILLLIFIIYTIYHYKPKFLIPATTLLILSIIIISKNHDRLDINYIKHEPRIPIWNLALDIIKEKPLVGHGVCHGRELFIEKSSNNPDLNRFWNFWHSIQPNYNKNRFHCHNAFLESAIEFGLFGLIITSLIFLLPILLTRGKKRLYLSFFVIIFGIQAMFESFTFHSQILLFCWLIYFFTNTNLIEE